MAGGLRISFEVTGLAPILAQLHEISDPKKLEKTTRESLGRSAVKIIAPRLAENPGWKYGGHGGANPTKGLLGNRRKITARKVRTRHGEMVAISVKPRGWAGTVEAWVVKGTRPHVIRARGAGQSGVDSRARRINRGTETLRDRGALAFGGRFAQVVKHPGAEPTNYIHDAIAPSMERQVVDQLEKDIFAAVARAKRRASAGGSR